MIPFEHHLDAQKWIEANASGDVCVIDSWTYGRMLFFAAEKFRGWVTVN